MGKLRITSSIISELLSEEEGCLATLSDMEKALEEAKADLANQAVDTLLERLGPEDIKPKPCPSCGSRAHLKNRDVPRSFEALSGRHRITRHYFYCKSCRHGFYPRDAALGLPPDGEVTYEMERRILDLAVNNTYKDCVARFRMHYGRSFSEKLFLKVVERVGKRLGETNKSKLYALAHPAPQSRWGTYHRLTIMNDGSMLPMQGGGWKEAKLAVMIRNDDEEASRYIGHFGGQEDFKKKLLAALKAERSPRYTEMVWIADGARSNWILSGDLTFGGTEVLDWYHAVENGMKCARVLLGEGSAWLCLWQTRLKELLYTGHIETLLEELMDCTEHASDAELEALNKLVGYYRFNIERMRYPDFRARGIPMGSGRVESGHRHVLQARMKLSGQHWSHDGAETMAELRALYRTTGAEKLYDT